MNPFAPGLVFAGRVVTVEERLLRFTIVQLVSQVPV